jgi:hypothetical protein
MWEIVLGDLNGTLAPPDISKLAAVLASFYLNFKDELNAPAEEFMPAAYPDGTIGAQPPSSSHAFHSHLSQAADGISQY